MFYRNKKTNKVFLHRIYTKCGPDLQMYKHDIYN